MEKVWYGRCIFLSWYCDVATCKFCFRSTQKHKIKHPKYAKRSIPSLLSEAILCKNLGWRIEFLTGGHKIMEDKDLLNIIKLISKTYGEKIWLNLGPLTKEQLNEFKPHIKGICASIETIEPKLHDEICPDKPIEPFEEMYNIATDFRRSMTMVIGLGEKDEDMSLLFKFIKKHNLDRITFYALKPIAGTMFENTETETEHYLKWIRETRKQFPDLQIIAGTTARRYKEVPQLIEAGANAFTKYPATKLFGTESAKEIETALGDKFQGTLSKLPDVDWDNEVDKLDFLDEELKEQTKTTLKLYLKRMEENIQKFK
jgi:biotin synthase-like enzyme